MTLIRVGRSSSSPRRPKAPVHRVSSLRTALAGVAGAALLCITWLLCSPATTRTAFACSCAGTDLGPRAAMARYDAVFVGRVIDAYDDIERRPNGYVTRHAALFEVERAYKGVTQSQVIVYTSERQTVGEQTFISVCEFTYPVGARYLVYADASGNNNNYLEDSFCSPTQRTGGELPELGPWYEPAVHVSLYDLAKHSTDKQSTNPLLLVGGIAAAACAALAAGLVRSRRRRPKNGKYETG